MSETTFSKEQILKIKNVFTQFDKNKNETIEKNELNSLAMALNNPLSPAELYDFFGAIDVDMSGVITWDEFINYWCVNIV
jgi:Ca2+-binding EF-hand superfamily protein